MRLKFSILICSAAILNFGCRHTILTQPDNHLSGKMKALIIDGENNHGIWPKTTKMMKDYLEETNLFEVDIARKKYTWQGPHHNVTHLSEITDLLTLYPIESSDESLVVSEPKTDPDFSPEFSAYDVVITNLGWKASPWPETTKSQFIQYIKNGGGLVVIHAADNSFGDWQEYNEMIGIGGWGGRNTESGPYVYYDKDNNLKRDYSEGPCGMHGPQSLFQVTSRDNNHPIMNGLPPVWMHAKDEIYGRLRGPAENMTILATAFSNLEEKAPPGPNGEKGEDRHEPVLMTIEYGKGKIFHTTLGHMDYSMECVGFITTFLRGTEWAASGQVTLPVPDDFPGKDRISTRSWNVE